MSFQPLGHTDVQTGLWEEENLRQNQQTSFNHKSPGFSWVGKFLCNTYFFFWLNTCVKFKVEMYQRILHGVTKCIHEFFFIQLFPAS